MTVGDLLRRLSYLPAEATVLKSSTLSRKASPDFCAVVFARGGYECTLSLSWPCSGG
jgi:hypothetical protein